MRAIYPISETKAAVHYIQVTTSYNQRHSSDAALPTTARRAKRENGDLGEDPPGSPMMTHQQVLWTCPHTQSDFLGKDMTRQGPLDLSAQTPNRTRLSFSWRANPPDPPVARFARAWSTDCGIQLVGAERAAAVWGGAPQEEAHMKA
jgi:hypothetical protein